MCRLHNDGNFGSAREKLTPLISVSFVNACMDVCMYIFYVSIDTFNNNIYAQTSRLMFYLKCTIVKMAFKLL